MYRRVLVRHQRGEWRRRFLIGLHRCANFKVPLRDVRFSSKDPVTGIVRPTKKPINFGPIRGVPKYGVGGGNRKNCFHGKVEVRDVKAAVDLHFLVFHVLVPFRVP